MIIPQTFFQLGVEQEQLARGASLEESCGVSKSDARRHGKKQMDVIRLDFQSENLPLAFLTNFPEQLFKRQDNLPAQNSLSVFRAPYHMVGRLINAVSFVLNLYHKPHGKRTLSICQAFSSLSSPDSSQGFPAIARSTREWSVFYESSRSFSVSNSRTSSIVP